ncbi:glycosyltransferase [Thermus sp.]|uniref:glycosyltransferase n=1 Tax=Thermus sp. TaxID=275 RepID=UPI00298F3CEC|nr:glycosyltransferase [Thermus sp.]MDW8357173.1 glycosyltransferase [Thermus sp.]
MAERKVALLIPVYNDQEGLEETLAHLPGEIPLDVVVVDDGSQPPITLPQLPPPHRAFLLRLDGNRGITGALNEGLRFVLARGYPYVARLEARDVALPGRFAKQLRFLEEHPEYALVGGQARFVDPTGRETHRERFPTEDGEIRRVMHARNPFLHPAVTLRTEALRAVGLYSERYPAAEDYELFFRLVKGFKVANLDEPVVEVLVNPEGISGKKRRRQLLTRLRILLENFDPGLKESWLGLLKNGALFFTPTPLVGWLKRRLPGRRGWL